MGRDAEAVTAASLSTLTGEIDTSGTARPVVVWNSLSHGRTGLVEVTSRAGAGVARGPDGATTALQPVAPGRAVFLASVPAFGYRVYDLVDGQPSGDPPRADAGPRHLENDRLRVELDDQGLLVSVFDRAPAVRCWPSGAGATSSSSIPTTRTSSTPGTSTPGTAATWRT